MRHDKHHTGREEEGHPSPELLRQYQADALPAPQSHRVERHLLACGMCADILEGMALSDADTTGAAVEELNRRIAARVKSDRQRTIPAGWQVAAAVLLLLCTAFVVVYYNYSNMRQEQRTVAEEREINRAFDFSAPPASAGRLGAPDSAGAPAPPGIALAPPPVAAEKKTVPLIAERDAEALEEDASDDVSAEEMVVEEDSEEKERAGREALSGVDPPSPVTASPPEAEVSVTESAPARIADASAAALESTRVSLALQGRAAGVTIRERNSLDKKDRENRVVTGQVLSEDGQPLPGVAVRLKGTGTGTTTDAKGHYALPVTGQKPTLQFSYIGYAAAEKAVTGNAAQVNVNMAPDLRALNEVVVTGYGVAEPGEVPAVVVARPAAGWRAYRRYLMENLRLPASSKAERGKVVVGLTVSASGEPVDVKVLQGLCPACDAEAIRLVKEGPAWKPATQAGSPVPQQVKVTVRFNR